MADHTQTISNKLAVVGGGPSTKWNDFLWGTGKWGSGSTPCPFVVTHHVTNSLTPTAAPYKLTKHQITNTLVPDNAVYRGASRFVQNSLAPTSDMTSETLSDPVGWYHVFPGPATNGESAANTTWTSATASTASWASASAAGTSWTSL